jgi:hypothetical protein
VIGRANLQGERDTIGYNVTALKYLQKEYYLRRESEFDEDLKAMKELSSAKRKTKVMSSA